MQDSIVESVVEKFKQRSEIGIKKYGVTLDRTDFSTEKWCDMLMEELMDAIRYCERLKRDMAIMAATKQ